MAPRVGFEPTTNRLTADRSTTELPRIAQRFTIIARQGEFLQALGLKISNSHFEKSGGIRCGG